MFLSDKLKQIVDNTELTEQGITASLQLMVQECFGHIQEQCKNANATDQTLIAAFQRCKIIWEQTAQYAIQQNKGFMKVAGFAELIKADAKFELIHKFL